MAFPYDIKCISYLTCAYSVMAIIFDACIYAVLYFPGYNSVSGVGNGGTLSVRVFADWG